MAYLYIYLSYWSTFKYFNQLNYVKYGLFLYQDVKVSK